MVSLLLFVLVEICSTDGSFTYVYLHFSEHHWVSVKQVLEVQVHPLSLGGKFFVFKSLILKKE